MKSNPNDSDDSDGSDDSDDSDDSDECSVNAEADRDESLVRTILLLTIK